MTTTTIISLFCFLYTNAETYDYGMVIDAGSTHSALYIYKFTDRVTSTNEPPQSTPMQTAASNDTGPIGALTSQTDCDTLIGTLVRFAKHSLSEYEDRWTTFPIYLKATAGMRILSIEDRERILGYILTSFDNTTLNPFLFDTTYAIIASGEEEATFDWLGVNFIWNNTLDNANSDKQTFGALDLGGQSTQIAFAPEPNSNILAGFTAVRLWEHTHRLYAHSFLQYGTNAIEQRIAELSYQLMTNSTTNVTVNPCLNKGVNITYVINGMSNVQIGNGRHNPFLCRTLMRVLLANDTDCYVQDCAFNGVYLAEIPQNMTFIAFSAFGYAVNGLNLSETIDLDVFYNQDTVDICNMTFEELLDSKYDTPGSHNFLNTYCRLNTYIFTLLHEGYGFSLTDTPIIFTNKYRDIAISWTQGSILRDSNWLPYDLEFVDDEALNSKGKMWRAMTITLASLLVVVLLGCAYLGYRAKKAATGTYDMMTDQ